MAYSFGVPGEAIWGVHVLVGLYFVYLGNMFLNKHSNPHGMVLMVIGVAMVGYHSFLAYRKHVMKKQ